MKTTLSVLASLLIVTLAIMSCDNRNSAAPASGIHHDNLVREGERLVTVLGCGDCHSPKVFGPQGPQPDPERPLSGHPRQLPLPPIDTAVLGNWVLFNHFNTAIAGPWGVSFASNITSHPTGIGSWTEERFARALRQGKSKGLDGNRSLLPPMPWQNYAQLTDDEVKAIFTYLQSTKPIDNVVPQPLPPAPRG